MEICIRKMVPSDLPDALDLLSRWNMAPTPEIPDAERSTIVIENSFVATRGDRLVGIASYLPLSKTLAETASLAVSPEVLGAGVGHRLQAARLDEMRQKGFRAVRTETDRPETIRWYLEKFGYREVGTNPKKHAFSLEGVDHWTVLELDLDQTRGAPPDSR